MICPQTKAECGCQSLLTCTLSSRDPSISYLYQEIAPARPTLAEIERLVDALVDACFACAMSNDDSEIAARAALMAAIRAYGRE